MLRYNDEVKIKASIVNGQESGQMVMNTYKAFCCETIALRQFCLYWFRLWIKMNIFENKLWPVFKNKRTFTHTHTHTHSLYTYIEREKLKNKIIQTEEFNVKECQRSNVSVLLNHLQERNGWYRMMLGGGAPGVIVIVVGNGHGDTSLNPGRDWLHFT